MTSLLRFALSDCDRQCLLNDALEGIKVAIPNQN